MSWRSDSSFDIGQGASGSSNAMLPKITKDGATTGPSPRRPIERRNPKMQSFSHQMAVDKMPQSAMSQQAPRKVGTGPALFPQGSVRTGLSAIKPVPSVTTR